MVHNGFSKKKKYYLHLKKKIITQREGLKLYFFNISDGTTKEKRDR